MSFDVFSKLPGAFGRQAPAPAIDPAFEAVLTLRLTATLNDASGPHGRWETSPALARTRTRSYFGSRRGFAAALAATLALAFVGFSWMQHSGVIPVAPAGSSAGSSAVVATYASFRQPTMELCPPGHFPGPTACDWCICSPYDTASITYLTPPPTPTPTATTTATTAPAVSDRTPPPTEQPTFPSPIPS